MARRNYASRLTKEELMLEGITEITPTGRVFKGDKEIFPFWVSSKTTEDYLGINILERDLDGRLVKGGRRTAKYTTKSGEVKHYETWNGKTRTIGLHRAMWAWHYGEVPEGMVCDHINNQHSRLEDYRLDNLQLMTPSDNLAKERPMWNTREVKCNLNKPRSFYESKLARYIEAYEDAKFNNDASRAHNLRTNISQTKARLRYYDSHIEEAEHRQEVKKMTEQEKLIRAQDIKDLNILRYWKRVFRSQGNKAMWHECCKVEKLWKAGELDQNAKNHCINVLNGLVGK